MIQGKPWSQKNMCMETVQNQVWKQELAFCCDGYKNARAPMEHFQTVFRVEMEICTWWDFSEVPQILDLLQSSFKI